MYTVATIASHLQVSDEQILAHIRAGRLKATNVGAGSVRPRWRISESQLQEFLAARATSAPVGAARRRKEKAIPEYV